MIALSLNYHFAPCGVIWGLRFSLLPASFECSRRRVGAMAGLTLFPTRRRSATAAVASKKVLAGKTRADHCWSVVCLRQVEASQKGETFIQEAWHEKGGLVGGRCFELIHICKTRFLIIVAFACHISYCFSYQYDYNNLKQREGQGPMEDGLFSSRDLRPTAQWNHIQAEEKASRDVAEAGNPHFKIPKSQGGPTCSEERTFYSVSFPY